MNPKNKGLIKITSVELPEGPIRFKRYDPSKRESLHSKKETSISTQMIWRLANAVMPNQPINVDRILGGSYNSRSVLEALLAHTPQFYYCYPGRIESINDTHSVKKGHKHFVWIPSKPHRQGKVEKIDTDAVISEIPSTNVSYDALVLPKESEFSPIDIDIKRRHSQIQIALYYIGKQLGFRTWIANNDKGIIYKNKKIGEYEGVIKSLENEKLIESHEEAVQAALLIDCIWFKNSRLMPAVMEIEHSTGVTKGLSRMKNFYDKFPPFPTRYVVVAADGDREKVIKEANKKQFHELKIKFFSYSSVEELYSLCQRRKLKGVTEEFLDCYMESVIIN